MAFRKTKGETKEKILEGDVASSKYWSRVKRRFFKNKLAKWSLRVLIVIFLVGTFSDFIANEKPLYCKIEGKTYFPILKQYTVDLGLSTWDTKFYQTPWSEHNYEKLIMPPIPYSHFTIDSKNSRYKSPFDNQDVASSRYWHWLGTDKLGKDVAAGMVRGARIAMLVGILSMLIASIIGIFFGVLGGFFGDSRLKVSRVRILLNIIGIFFAYFYGFQVRGYVLSMAGENGTLAIELIKSLFIVFIILLLFNLLAQIAEKNNFLSKKITVPVDIIVMRIIEIMNSIPALFLLLAVMAILEQPSIISVMVIIGLIRWTGIARFVRAELLRIRSLEYIEAAEAMGFKDWRIIFRHGLPNAIAPVLITIAFGIASAILIEAILSFLGIGLALEEVTWGELLSYARQNTSAWWLALFPGLAIFITVTVLNLIGDGLTDALDPKSKV